MKELVFEKELLRNLLMNLNFIYTDITMLLLGTPGYTQSPYLYYLGYYIGDLFGRLT